MKIKTTILLKVFIITMSFLTFVSAQSCSESGYQTNPNPSISCGECQILNSETNKCVDVDVGVECTTNGTTGTCRVGVTNSGSLGCVIPAEVNCKNDYDCLEEQLNKGNAVTMSIDEEISLIAMKESSTLRAVPKNKYYKVTMQVVNFTKLDDSKSTKSITQQKLLDCPKLLDNIDQLKNKSAVCKIYYSASKVRDLAENGLSDEIVASGNCEGDLIHKIYEICDNGEIPENIVARKPAIYLYPSKETDVKITVTTNGHIIKSIPEYKNGWKVKASPTGMINEKYDYLFYEVKLNDLTLPKEGWVVDYKDLSRWFDENLPAFGLNSKETGQFKEYWLTTLSGSPYFEIKLLDSDYLNKKLQLNVTPKPDTFIRVFLNFKPLKSKINIAEPKNVAKKINRDGFTLVEWGGILAD